MSSSSNSPSRPMPIQDVEAFIYDDTSHSMTAEFALDSSPRTESPSAGQASATHVSDEQVSRIASEARAEGVREGESRARTLTNDELDRERKRVADTLAQFENERIQYYSKVESELVQLALSIAAKILHREAQVDRMLLASLVRIALQKLQQSTNIILKVPVGETATWQKYFQDISGLQVFEDELLQASDCILETDVGSAHLGVDAQLKEIEKGFFDLLAQRPTTK